MVILKSLPKSNRKMLSQMPLNRMKIDLDLLIHLQIQMSIKVKQIQTRLKHCLSLMKVNPLYRLAALNKVRFHLVPRLSTVVLPLKFLHMLNNHAPLLSRYLGLNKPIDKSKRKLRMTCLVLGY